MRTLKRELLYFTAVFVVPCLGWIVLETILTASAIPFSQRVVCIEDTCAYGMCFFVPGFVYATSRIAILLMQVAEERGAAG